MTVEPTVTVPSSVAAAHVAPSVVDAQAAHVPAIHDSPPVQRLPHVPQFALSTRPLISQPLAVLPSQLSQPALQPTKVQAPETQATEELAMEHALPQPPQLATSMPVSFSQPSAAMLLQSVAPAWQAV